MRVYTIESGFQNGAYNMALDECLLETVRRTPAHAVLIVRTYQWEEPTLSLGVNQAVKDIGALLALYGQTRPVRALVRRPTGGRAILHGEDISYAFITNDPALLRKSLKDSYATLAALVRETLAGLDLPVRFSGTESGRDYLRSPVCFETHTPSDLLAKDGRKLSGSAQLRRAGGLLQHGATFLQPYGIAPDRFSHALFETVAKTTGCTPEPFPLASVAALQEQLEASYRKTSGEILDSALTTSGSHLEPASC